VTKKIAVNKKVAVRFSYRNAQQLFALSRLETTALGVA